LNLAKNTLRVLSDNKAAIGIINKMGTCTSQKCDQIAKLIWCFCEKNKIRITSSYISSIDNKEANTASRKSYIDAEWQLCPEIFWN